MNESLKTIFLLTWLGLGLGLGLRLSDGVAVDGSQRMGNGLLGLGQAETGGEDQTAEVDAELPAPDGDPLEVPDLHVGGHLESDGLSFVLAEDGGLGVPVLEVGSLGVQDEGFVVSWDNLWVSLSSNPEESVWT